MEEHGNKVTTILKTCNTNQLKVEQISKDFGDNQLRLLHIDAGHEYHEVMKILKDFSPFLDDQGILIMDDFQDTSSLELRRQP